VRKPWGRHTGRTRAAALPGAGAALPITLHCLLFYSAGQVSGQRKTSGAGSSPQRIKEDFCGRVKGLLPGTGQGERWVFWTRRTT